MSLEALKVGDLAKRTGLTIRTLHHYDEIGLLKPSLHTESGHRLYTADDVARLQQVISMRQLGFGLEEIGHCLDRPDFSPIEVIRLHLARLREQLELQRKLCERLEGLMNRFQKAEKVSADEFLFTIEVMNMIENYYTLEQMEMFKKRFEADPQGVQELARQGTADWNALIADYGAAMEQGIAPSDPKAQALEKRRQALVQAFSGGDQAIEQSLKRMWTEQRDNLCAQWGYDPKVMEYMMKVSDGGNGS